MKIVSVEFSNFGPFFGDHKLDLDGRGLTLVMGDNQDEPRMNSNGAGKSTIFDALDWGLFGKIPRGDHVDSIKNDEAKDVHVAVKMERDDGTPIMVERGRGSKKYLNFHVGAENRTTLDMAETQGLIEHELGLDREVFHAAVLFGQFDLVHYADSTDSERMGILTQILQLGQIDEYLDKAKALAKGSTERHIKLDAEVAGKSAYLAQLRELNFDDRIRQWNDQHVGQINQLKQTLGSLEVTLCEKEGELKGVADVQGDIQRIQGEIDGYPTPNNDELQKANGELQQVQSILDVKLHEKTSLERQVLKWQSKGLGVCSECGQEVTLDHLDRELTKVGEKLKTITEDAQKVYATLQHWKQLVQDCGQRKDAAWENYHNDLLARKTEINALRSTEQHRQYLANDIQRAKSEVDRVRGLLFSAESVSNPHIDQAQHNALQIQNIEKEKAILEDTKRDIEGELAYLNFWVEAFGPKGLKSYILDLKLQELNDAVNQWVNILTGGTIWVQFESQKKTRDKRLVNSPDIRVFRWNPDGTVTERNFKSWSGGEKQRISFAIDFGLSRLIAHRATQRFDLLILDEVFRHLDQAGKEAVMEMLKLLSQEKSSLFVVEHDTDFQSMFDNQIIVQKNRRRSVIKESFDEYKKQTEGGRKAQLLPARANSENRPKRTPVRAVRN